MESITERLAASVRAELARGNMSAAEMARRLGWSQAYLQRRLGTRSQVALDFTIPELALIAAELGIPLSQLLPEDAVA